MLTAMPVWIPIAGGGLLMLLALSALLLRRICRRPRPSAAPTDDALDERLQASGFAYDDAQDIFYSRRDAWQRAYGYRRLYDEAAAPLGMVLDCEPVYFRHGGKRWLIELWKGQYGMCCGAEIGVYNAPLSTAPPETVYYQSAADAHQLPMAFRLKSGKRTLFTRQARHWWLTAFRLGEFRHPEELTMFAQVTMADAAMRRAFVEALRALGYGGDALYVRRRTVFVRFDRPHSPQPASRATYAAASAMRRNERLCALWHAAVGGQPTLAALRDLRASQPALYDAAFGMTRPRAMYEPR